MTISDPVAVEPKVRLRRNEPEVRLRRNTARAGRGDNLLSARAALLSASASAAEYARRLARRLELFGAPADDRGGN